MFDLASARRAWCAVAAVATVLASGCQSGTEFTSAYGQPTGPVAAHGHVANEPAQLTTKFGFGYVTPAGVAAWNGNVFVADPAARSVTEFTSSGVALNVGSGFSSPTGIAVDAAGNVYVSDRSKGQIWKIAPPFAAPTYGTQTLLASGLVTADGVAVDAAGVNVFVAVPMLHEIALISGTSKPQMFGPSFKTPVGVALDTSGNVYVADLGSHSLFQLSSNGTLLATFGNVFRPLAVAVAGQNIYFSSEQRGDTVPAEAYRVACLTCPQEIVGAGFLYPQGIAVTAQGVFVADRGRAPARGFVYEVEPAGTLRTIGTGFSHPHNLSVDGRGNVYVADTGDNAVRVIRPTGQSTRVGKAFESVGGVAVEPLDSDVNPMHFLAEPFLVADSNGIARVTDNGKKTTELGGRHFNRPEGVAVDTRGKIYVADTQNYRIAVMSPNGDGVHKIGNGRYNLPSSIAVDDLNDVLFVATNAVYKIWPSGKQSQFTQLLDPTAVATDIRENVYVSDIQHDAVYLLTPAGNVVGALGSGFFNPVGVAVDREGNVYIADTGPSRGSGAVYEYTPPSPWPPASPSPWTTPTPAPTATPTTSPTPAPTATPTG